MATQTNNDPVLVAHALPLALVLHYAMPRSAAGYSSAALTTSISCTA